MDVHDETWNRVMKQSMDVHDEQMKPSYETV